MKKNRKFNLGDKVIAQDGVVGVVINKKGMDEYPIVVKFNNDYRSIRTYTEDGLQYMNEEEFWIRKLTKLDKALK
jgi:glutamate dehydrogenase/leucine dehydrogenase